MVAVSFVVDAWCLVILGSELYQFGFMHRALLPVCFCFIDVGLLALVSHLLVQRRIFFFCSNPSTSRKTDIEGNDGL